MDEAADIIARTQRFDDAARTFTQQLPTPHAKLTRAIVVLLQKGALAAHVNAAAGHSRCGGRDGLHRTLTPPKRMAIRRRNDRRNERPSARGCTETGSTSTRRRLSVTCSGTTAIGSWESSRGRDAVRRAKRALKHGRPSHCRSSQPLITHKSVVKQINLVINGKGVGKNFFATNFVQYLKDRGIPHPAVNSDSRLREIDRIFIVTETRDLLAIDGRASSTGLFIDFFDEVCLVEVPRLRH
jgi:hypothetical protein